VLRQTFSNLDFLVVQDGYHPTPTTELADLVLPAAIWGEKEGTFTNSERRVSRVNTAVEPAGEARTDSRSSLVSRKRLVSAKNSFPAGPPSKTPSTSGAWYLKTVCAITPASVRHPPQSGWLDGLGRLKGGRWLYLGVAGCAPLFTVQN
jgi:molybdopterin-dependent oxidoreductase-like protein